MRKTRKLVSALLATTMVASAAMGTTETFARSSKRAAWNNAAAASNTTMTAVKDACFTEDGSETPEHEVASNVYANTAEWSAWQETWKSIRNNYEQVALTPGRNATELNFAWYSMTKETPKIKLTDANGISKEFTGTQDETKAETIVEDGVSTTLYPNKVTVTGLTENTAYTYQYFADGAYSESYDYKTQSTDSFSVMYVGDPQIGASTGQAVDGEQKSKEYYAMNDAYNWAHTLANAASAHPDLSFILSAGDQINQTNVSKDTEKLQQQIEYAGFLYPSVLRSIPLATTIGNHDSKSANYSNHFNNPNTAATEATTKGATTAGTDYYFRYGNTLFVSIDTNNYNCATHENVIKEATEANPDATWKILMFHQDIYGSGYDHSDSDGIILRTQLTPIIDKYDFDAVLQGHDHTYSRTYQLTSDGKNHTAYDKNSAPGTPDAAYLSENNCYNILTGETQANKVADPDGTVYFEANSSTGSKYYQLIGTQQNYIAARSQSWRPTYSVLDITENTLTVKTYDAATNQELVADGGIKTSYTIVKSVDKESLQAEITNALQQLETAKAAGNYSEDVINNLSAMIAQATDILNNAEADSKNVASAVTSLQDAVAALETGILSSPENEKKDEQSQGSNSTAESSPKTGDSIMPMALWFSLSGLSLAGLSGLTIAEKRKKKKAENQ